ncbi:TRAP transporter small permease [Oricola sp.]|uniref:TRAP transporter small permease subunit n=1 Tax=Oricola sp. TaxID=1979950 RepID=UPI0025E29B2C|nr:TRAP transporter small permease [Oricola sp.]MCI5077124.1 TRAP transporter small permease [Oricola sp.]
MTELNDMKPTQRDGGTAGPLGPVVAGLNALGSVWIIGLMLLVCADIAMRTLFNAPIAGVAEMVAFSIVGIVFLQLSHTLRSGALTRSDLLILLVERRSPKAARVITALFNLVGAGVLALAFWYFLPSLTKAWTHPERNFMGNPGFFQIPTWPLYLLMAIGMAATVLQYLASAWQSLAGASDERS